MATNILAMMYTPSQERIILILFNNHTLCLLFNIFLTNVRLICTKIC